MSDMEPDDAGLDRPSWARVDSYLLRGKDHFTADREFGDAMIALVPGLRQVAQDNRRFLLDAVRHLATHAGVRQFLDIGSAYPVSPWQLHDTMSRFGLSNVHDVAQDVDPTARVVYVDHDSIVAAHARALLSGTDAGRVEFVHADARKPHSILGDPDLVATIGLDEPVGLIMTAVLMCFPDDEVAEIVATLVDWLPAGSYLVASHPAAESDQAALRAVAGQAGLTYVPRTREQVSEFLRRPRPGRARGGADAVVAAGGGGLRQRLPLGRGRPEAGDVVKVRAICPGCRRRLRALPSSVTPRTCGRDSCRARADQLAAELAPGVDAARRRSRQEPPTGELAPL